MSTDPETALFTASSVYLDPPAAHQLVQLDVDVAVKRPALVKMPGQEHGAKDAIR
jgi:hypothetical protein